MWRSSQTPLEFLGKFSTCACTDTSKAETDSSPDNELGIEARARAKPPLSAAHRNHSYQRIQSG